MNKTIALLIAILIGCGANCFAQGKVSRPTQQQSQTSKLKKSTPKVTVSEPDGYINGHGFVDLGLPSGTKWATCNVGAKSPEEYGEYFAWGETYTKSKYTLSSSSTVKKSEFQLQMNGVVNSEGMLDRSLDVANANVGETWRMPTRSDYEELLDNCTFTWTIYGNKNGYKVMGKNGKFIFFPAGGYRKDSLYENVGEGCFYWCSTIYDDSYGAGAYCFCGFGGNGNYGVLREFRYYGFSVRPVSS